MKTGLTYSDVLLVPQKTVLSSRSEASLNTLFTKNVSLHIPFVSSNMATVTEHKMAIAMARAGGIGIIHQFLSIEEQAQEVHLVKKSTSYTIRNPLCVRADITINDAIELMEQERVTSLLVTKMSTLAGIFTKRDYLFETDFTKEIKDVMTSKVITANDGISLPEAKRILHKNKIEKLPLVNERNEVTGLITTQDIVKLERLPNAARDAEGRLLCGAALGVKDTIERATALISSGVDVLVLDVAHGHSDLVIQKLKELKSTFPTTDVMVGNIATAQGAQDMISAGADGLKVGIGPSPVCTTRVMSGAGVPQFTAVQDVCAVAKKHGIPVTADGGAKYPGDCVKALAAGASTIYSGSFFAGTDESPGMITQKDGRRFKKYMGSASYASNHLRKEQETRGRLKEKINVFVEGVETLVDYKGPVGDVLDSLCKGVRSGISYGGGRTITEMQDLAEFVRITGAGWAESLSRGHKLSE